MLLMLFTCIGLTSCEDNKTTDDFSGDNPIVMVLAYAPAEGYDYSYYSVQYKSIAENNLTLSAQGTGDITQVGYYEYSQIDETLYSLGGLTYTDVSAITRDDNGNLEEAPFGVNFINAIQDMVITHDNKIVAIEMSSSSDVVVLHLINSQTNEIETSVTTPCNNISSTIISDTALPVNTGLAQSGNYVYVSYMALTSSYTTPDVSHAEVAVFTYPGLEYVKTITDERTGPIGGWGTNSGLFLDESGNVYAVSHTNIANGYSQSNETAGFLRINYNETTFDSNYFFDLTATGNGYTTANALYMGANKAFAEMNTASRDEQVAWSDGPLKSAIIDLEEQAVTYFEDCPQHNSAAQGRKLESIATYTNGVIYAPLATDDGLFVYILNPSDMSVKKGAAIDASFVAGTFRLK